jgi:hypothetical protein
VMPIRPYRSSMTASYGTILPFHSEKSIGLAAKIFPASVFSFEQILPFRPRYKISVIPVGADSRR